MDTSSKLSKFLVEESLNLDKISNEIKSFNPFDVLGIVGYEIRHSNFLAWIMNPKGSHGLGDFVLKSFLSQLRIPDEEKIEHLLDDLSNVSVLREVANIDILVINELKSWVILIENKVWASKSGENQLIRYFDSVREKYSEDDKWKIYPIYLTPAPRALDDGESEIGFQNFNYFGIVQILNTAIENFNLDGRVSDFIQFYCKTVNNSIMNTENETVRLAQEIYRKHRDAIEYIISKKPIIYTKERFGQIGEWVKKQPDLENLTPYAGDFVRFLPKEVKSVFVDERFESWGGANVFFAIEFFIEGEQLRLKFCFGNIRHSDETVRLKLQKKKTAYFEAMQKFNSLKNKMCVLPKSRSTSTYPPAAWAKLMTVHDDEFIKDEFMTAVEIKFSKFRNDVLESWIEEVKSKLIPIQKQHEE